ncbi:fatty acyl-CoA reductase wat-like [Uranotaenia lowii]|uniref:fatty acyl-CoA reductase wat-like n=1 Tax=Uranotaenia lowii TaxID=190385 RepID=UPI00247A773C|nr:fatty acyl-CoA reductase wat-like [Uranotaenia lowii]
MGDCGILNVREFYQDSVILISGASGFVGQVLLEKILRSLNPRKVYVMIRSKKDSSADERLIKMFEDPLFNAVKTPKLMDKIIPVEVNFDQTENVIPEIMMNELCDEVTVVFNLLASINFNEPLDCALKVNVDYTDRILELANQMKRIKSVVHISTFYSNCDKNVIEERIYEDIGFGGCDNIRNILSKLGDYEKEVMTKQFIGGLPNTYTFSKKCAEVLIKEKFTSLPIGIFRPPIVSSAYREPLPGWIDNFNGPSGMVAPLSEGLYSAVRLDPAKKPFIVPVDYCVNAMLVCAVDITSKQSSRSVVPVYNYTESEGVRSWDQIVKNMVQGLPLMKRILASFLTVTVTKNRLRYAWAKAIMMLQGHLLDVILQLRGRKPMMAAIFGKMISLSRVLEFFCLNEWTMHNENTHRLLRSMSEEELKIFPFDLTSVDWEAYYRNFVSGVVQYAIEPRKKKFAMSENNAVVYRSIWHILELNRWLKTIANFLKSIILRHSK